MSKHTRREFIAGSLAAGVSAAAAGPLLGQQAAAGAKPADMTIAKWSGASENLGKAQLKQIAVKLTEQAINGLGGLARFVGKGDVVWVKPNIAWDCAPELSATTNPDVVATIVRLCFEAGAKTVKVGDHTCNVAAKTYKTSGIADAAAAAGAKIVYVDSNRFRRTALRGERLKSLLLYPEILETDLVINVPVVKHHGLPGATLCMKNYMGVMDDRRPFHQALPVCVADLTRFMKPQICVMDAVRILTAHGPRGGNPRDVQLKTTVAAGTDIVALDALGAELLGRKPTDIKTIVKGADVGLGTMDYRSLALREIKVA